MWDTTNRIIIENRTTMSDSDAVSYVASVIQAGRVSDDGQCYCFVSQWQNGVTVYARRNKKSDKFIVAQHDKGTVGQHYASAQGLQLSN